MFLQNEILNKRRKELTELCHGTITNNLIKNTHTHTHTHTHTYIYIYIYICQFVTEKFLKGYQS